MKHTVKYCFVVVFSMLLISCQNINNQSTMIIDKADLLYLDDQFPQFEHVILESSQDIFAIDNEMKLMVKNKLLPERNIRRRAIKLLKNIFESDNINLAYESGANISAIEAFHSQKANCLSLTIMAYVLAKEAGFDINFQNVDIPEYWVRDGQYNLLTGHINLVIKGQADANADIVYGSNILEIDFDPFVLKKSFPKNVITKSTVLAMFYNNKGAQALVDLDFNKAYAYFKAATKSDPNFGSAWGNLGILYRLTGHEEQAIDTYRAAISLDKDNLTALTNLALLLHKQGFETEADKIEKMLHKKRINNPYYHALLADEALFKGDSQAALLHYKKAVKLDKNAHEFYFGLAKTYYALNKINHAKKALAKAIALNHVKSVDRQYLAKMNIIKEKELLH